MSGAARSGPVSNRSITSALVVAAAGVVVGVGLVRDLPAVVVAGLVTTIAVVVVNDVLTRRQEARLRGRLAEVAAERQRVLDRVVRLLEVDRRRVATGLRRDAVDPLHELGALVQTAYLSLPPGTALVAKESIAEIQDTLASRTRSLQRLAVAVHPPLLEDGVVAALRTYAAELFGDRSGTLVQIDVDPAQPLGFASEIIIYRIAQEALDNVAAHATAPTVRVQVTNEGGAVLLRIEDDGVGFDPATTDDGAGFGIIRSLAELAGGSCTIESVPDRGTSITVVVGAMAFSGGASDESSTAARRAHGRRTRRLDRATSGK